MFRIYNNIIILLEYIEYIYKFVLPIFVFTHRVNNNNL